MQPNNKGIRACVKGLSEAAWRAESGSIDTTWFLDYCAATLGAARQLEREPNFNSYLVALALRAVLYDDLRAALAYGVLKPRNRSAVLEMLDRLDGRFADTTEDAALRARFDALATSEEYGFSARIGRAFLRKYRELVP